MSSSSENPASSESETLGMRLKEAREAIGLPQVAVADHLSIPRASVSDIETGRRRVTFLELKQLAALYRRPYSYFLRGRRGRCRRSNSTGSLSHRLRTL